MQDKCILYIFDSILWSHPSEPGRFFIEGYMSSRDVMITGIAINRGKIPNELSLKPWLTCVCERACVCVSQMVINNNSHHSKKQ